MEDDGSAQEGRHPSSDYPVYIEKGPNFVPCSQSFWLPSITGCFEHIKTSMAGTKRVGLVFASMLGILAADSHMRK